MPNTCPVSIGECVVLFARHIPDLVLRISSAGRCVTPMLQEQACHCWYSQTREVRVSLQGGLGQGCFGVVDMLVLPVHITEYIVASLELSERSQRQKLWISM